MLFCASGKDVKITTQTPCPFSCHFDKSTSLRFRQIHHYPLRISLPGRPFSLCCFRHLAPTCAAMSSSSDSTKTSEKQGVATSTAVAVDAHTDHHHPDLSELRHADDALLAQLGYKSEFKREFSVSPSTLSHRKLHAHGDG